MIQLAHVKWFVNATETESIHVDHFHFTEPAVLVWCLIIIGFIALAWYLNRYERQWFQHLRLPYYWQIFSSIIGLSLLLAAAYGTLLTPEYHSADTVSMGLLYLEYITAVLWCSTLLPGIASLTLVLLYSGMVWRYGWDNMADHVFWLGVALYPWWKVTGLRIMAGASLVIVACHEKLLNPALSTAFLAGHHWNFMQQLGLDWFDDRLFVLSAGMVELLIGVLLMLGWCQRTTAVVLAGFMTITAIILGPSEVIGHLPFVAIALAIICVPAAATTASKPSSTN